MHRNVYVGMLVLLIGMVFAYFFIGRPQAPAQPGESEAADAAQLESSPPTPELTSNPAVEPVEEPAQAKETLAAAEDDEKTVVEFWSTDNEPERLAVYEQVAERFMAQNPDVEVRIVPIDESTFSQTLAQAQVENRVPDIARLGIERVASLAAVGLLDETAAQAVIERVGVDDFRDGPIQMVINPESGKPLAVPYDGWIQAIWYRRDLFESLGLEAPVTWAQVDAACDALAATEKSGHALTLATTPEQNYVHQLFEQVAMSNDAWPFDEAGNVTMNSPQMVDALRFYTDLQRCAPAGTQDLFDARERYELGQASLLFYSTYIMDDLVEGSDLQDGSGKVEIAVDDLAGKSSFASSLVGPGGVASYGQLATLGITNDAVPAAQDVVEFFLTDGYLDIIALAPLGKVPVLESAVNQWSELSPIFDHYSPATLGHIANSYDTMQRWLFRPEYTNHHRAVIGEIEGRLLIPQVVHNIAVEGTMTPESGAQWLQEQVEDLMAKLPAG